MDINAGIIDQRLSGILDQHAVWFEGYKDDIQRRSAAFVLLCMSVYLDLDLEDVAGMMTEGGNDAGIDGVYIGDVSGIDFSVILFQGKYKQKLDGKANFPENAVVKMIQTIGQLFDPRIKKETNNKIKPEIEEIRSLVRDGLIPNVKVVLCNNGAAWQQQTQDLINRSSFPGDQVEWVHFNHDRVIDLLRQDEPVDDKLRFSGEAILEQFPLRRVLIGKVNVAEIARIFEKHGDRLLQKNIRLNLGLSASAVNRGILATLEDDQKRNNFYFYNNGITIICKQIRLNELQGGDWQSHLRQLQIVNGGQTSKTIQHALKNSSSLGKDDKAEMIRQNFSKSYVLVRIYELEEDDDAFVREITEATNSQNPVNLSDLRSNDEIQQQLALGMKDLGYTYKRQRSTSNGGSKIITPNILAEAVLAVWRKRPQQAKYHRKQHFNKLYHLIFDDLQPAAGIIAVSIFRFVENERKRPSETGRREFVPYATHYLSMLIGQFLLEISGIDLAGLDHRSYPNLQTQFDKMKDTLYLRALNATEAALSLVYKDAAVSLQQLAATFRRGDLLEFLG